MSAIGFKIVANLRARSLHVISTIRLLKLLALSLSIVTGFGTPATAHPHITVDARAALIFNAEGELASIHHTWTFDEAYSAWAVQGLDADRDGKVTREELQSLANDNVKGLADYHFYTFAGEGSTSIAFPTGSNPTLDYLNGKLVLNFDVTPAAPYAIQSSLELAVNDPQYYVAITFADASTVKLVNAPAVCTYRMEKGRPMPDDVAARLYALPPDVTKIPPELEVALRGVQGGIRVDCTGGTSGHGTSVAPPAPATTLEAVNQLGEIPVPVQQGNASAVTVAPSPPLLAIIAALAAAIALAVAFVYWRFIRR